MKRKSVDLLKVVTTRNIFPSEVKRLERLLSYITQFNRLKFGNEVPNEYASAADSIKELIPQDLRADSYAQLEITESPSAEYVGETITAMLQMATVAAMSNRVKSEILRIVDLNLFYTTNTEVSDVSSPDSTRSSPHQVVPDIEQPKCNNTKAEPE